MFKVKSSLDLAFYTCLYLLNDTTCTRYDIVLGIGKKDNSDNTVINMLNSLELCRLKNVKSIYSKLVCTFSVNVGEDCPVFDGMYEFCQLSTGGSVGKFKHAFYSINVLPTTVKWISMSYLYLSTFTMCTVYQL